jgi:hypothetical protein
MLELLLLLLLLLLCRLTTGHVPGNNMNHLKKA